MKCSHCGSENIMKGKLCDWHTISFYDVKKDENGDFGGMPTSCDVCADCGTVTRIYVEAKHLEKLKNAK